MRIVAFAYACEPQRGSEPAAGWFWTQMLAQLGETWVITRSNNRTVIESELRNAGALPHVHFVYVDLPPSVRRWKRGQRGVRLYYLLWQRAALREARRLHEEHSFDLAWHLTLANAWIGSMACLMNIPFIYGPVGGGVAAPWRLADVLGPKGVLYEVTRAAARTFGRYLNPLARTSWRRAALILVQNDETKRWLPRRYLSKSTVFPNVILEAPSAGPKSDTTGVMLFAGRLMPLKGVALAIRALEHLPEWRLIVCGDGPDSRRLRRLANRQSVEDRVEFRGWVERDELLRTMREEASVFVFPSLHDEAGWVVVEAMASKLPVVCLERGGPPLLAGHAGIIVSSKGGSKKVVRELAAVLLSAEFPPAERLVERARDFSLARRLQRLRGELRERAG